MNALEPGTRKQLPKVCSQPRWLLVLSAAFATVLSGRLKFAPCRLWSSGRYLHHHGTCNALHGQFLGIGRPSHGACERRIFLARLSSCLTNYTPVTPHNARARSRTYCTFFSASYYGPRRAPFNPLRIVECVARKSSPAESAACVKRDVTIAGLSLPCCTRIPA